MCIAKHHNAPIHAFVTCRSHAHSLKSYIYNPSILVFLNPAHISTRLQHALPGQLDLLGKLSLRPPALGPANRNTLTKLNLVLCSFPRAGTVVGERDAREGAGAEVFGAVCFWEQLALCACKSDHGAAGRNAPFSYCAWYHEASLRTFCCCCCCCCCWPPNIWSKKPNWACAVSSQRLSAAMERAKRGMFRGRRKT